MKISSVKSILVAAANDEKARQIADVCAAKGWSAQIIRFDTYAPGRLPSTRPRAAIILPEQKKKIAEELACEIRSFYTDFAVPIIAVLPKSFEDKGANFDTILPADSHPMQIFARTLTFSRLADMQQEIALRIQTLSEDFGQNCALPKAVRPGGFRMLFVGKAAPEFMAVQNALARRDVVTIAAFTSFTAFDYLYEQEFDAVLLNGLDGSDTAIAIGQTMRKNAKLFHVPALLMVNEESFNDHDRAYEAGIDDIITVGNEVDSLASRMLEHANFHMMHNRLKAEFGNLGGSTCMDMATGMFNNTFFNAHLARVTRHCKAADMPVTVCLVRVRPEDESIDPGAIAPGYRDIGMMIKNLVRMQDISARLSTNLFAIAFPGQSAEDLDPVMERIGSILKLAIFSDPKTGAALKIKLDLTLNTVGSKKKIITAA